MRRSCATGRRKPERRSTHAMLVAVERRLQAARAWRAAEALFRDFQAQSQLPRQATTLYARLAEMLSAVGSVRAAQPRQSRTGKGGFMAARRRRCRAIGGLDGVGGALPGRAEPPRGAASPRPRRAEGRRNLSPGRGTCTRRSRPAGRRRRERSPRALFRRPHREAVAIHPARCGGVGGKPGGSADRQPRLRLDRCRAARLGRREDRRRGSGRCGPAASRSGAAARESGARLGAPARTPRDHRPRRVRAPRRRGRPPRADGRRSRRGARPAHTRPDCPRKSHPRMPQAAQRDADAHARPPHRAERSARRGAGVADVAGNHGHPLSARAGV